LLSISFKYTRSLALWAVALGAGKASFFEAFLWGCEALLQQIIPYVKCLYCITTKSIYMRWSMKYIYKPRLKTLLFISISIALLVSVAFANGAKPIQDPAGNGGLIFDENPGVALLNEIISFDVIDSTYSPQAIVTVEYEMKNLMEQEQSFDMFFVIPPFYGNESATPYKVNLDGKDISLQSSYKDIEGPNNWKPAFPQGLVEPYSQKIYDTNLEDDTGMGRKINPKELTGINIPIYMKANSTSKLIIEYSCAGGFNRRPQFLNTINNFMYYLTPAKYWNQEPLVTLNVKLLSEKEYTLHSNIPLKVVSQNFFTAKLDSLPDSEWVFSFVDRQGLIYGTNDSKTHALITLFISVALCIVTLASSWKFKTRAYAIWGYILAVTYFYLFKGKLVDGYIGEFLVMVPISIILIFVIPISYYTYYKHKAKDSSLT
jgi:hypothetical protein